MENNKTGTAPKKIKKTWQTPTVELLARGYVEGGNNASAHEATLPMHPVTGRPGYFYFHRNTISRLTQDVAATAISNYIS